MSSFLHSLNELYVICLIEMSFNVSPRNIHGMNKLSINVCPSDVREDVDVTSESGLHGLNDLNGIG